MTLTHALQRSRARVSAEIYFSPIGGRGYCSASTEPRSGERGDNGQLVTVTDVVVASTEPRSGERGDSRDGREWMVGHYASTEPRSGERGDLVAREYAATLANLLQRSRARVSAEIRTPFRQPLCLRNASTEPRSGERGDADCLWLTGIASSRFNGAALG